MSDFINVVLLVRGRFKLTEQCLLTLARNTPRDKYRLTVVHDWDEREDFRTTRLLSILDRDCVVRVSGSSHRVGKLKTLGVQASRLLHGEGEWLYVGDGDTAFLPDWSEKIVRAAQLSEAFEYKLWGGQIHPFHHPSGCSMVGEQDVQLAEHEVLDGPSWLTRWSTWDQVGPLIGEAPGPCQSEDAEWCARLRTSGGRIGVVVPHVVAHTGLTQTDGRDAPGRKEREAQKVQGVLYE